MHIDDNAGSSNPLEAYQAVAVHADGFAGRIEELIQIESTVQVNVNGMPAMELTCSADHIVELVIGRLFTEGLVEQAAEIDVVRASSSESGVTVDVALSDPNADIMANRFDVVSTCFAYNGRGKGRLTGTSSPENVVPIAWSPEQVFALARIFEQDTPIHRQTFGAHSCYLCKGTEVLYCCEDLGRHNAFDKVIGCALRDDVDLRECLVFTSGRIPTDMAVKAVRARIPIIVSKAVPTNLTVEMAHACMLTLICSAHSDSFKVLNDPLGICPLKR